MKVEVDLTEYGVKTPRLYDPINLRIINATGGSGPEPRQNKVVEYTVTEIVRRESSFIVNAEV